MFLPSVYVAVSAYEMYDVIWQIQPSDQDYA